MTCSTREISWGIRFRDDPDSRSKKYLSPGAKGESNFFPSSNRQTQQYRLSNLSPFSAVAREGSSTTAQLSLMQRILNVQFRTSWQNPCQFFKRVGQEVRLAVITSGKRACSLHGPIHVVRNVCKESLAIARFQGAEDLVDVGNLQ